MTALQLNQRCNHPQKGAVITSKPIVSREKVDLIKSQLADRPRDLALFVTGINSAFRASDLLTLKVGDVKHDVLCRREKKTGKVRRFYLNGAIKRAVAPLIEGRDDNDWLFPSEKTGQPLTVPTFSSMVKLWCFRAGLRGGYSAHSLRKTWARVQVDAGEPLWKISEAFGHSSEKITRLYLGLQVEEMKSMYMREV